MSYLDDIKAERASINIITWNKPVEIKTEPICEMCRVELRKYVPRQYKKRGISYKGKRWCPKCGRTFSPISPNAT